jgi:protoporphyrinogen oxidase
VICTLPSSLFAEITRGLGKKYISRVKKIRGLGAVNLLLTLNNSFLKDGTYWLNINDIKYPFLVVVEHTNFISKKNYGGNFMVYVGNYVERDHPYFSKSPGELVDVFLPYLKEINPSFSRKWILNEKVFTVPFAQPIIPLNYSRKILPFETPIEGLFLCNIEQVYPWDRGTNYAVELGENISNLIIRQSNNL